MTNRTTATVHLRMTLMSHLLHGAGNSGNTTKMRTQDIIDPETGEQRRVPFVSGNALKGQLRRAAARHACRVLGIEDASISKNVVDLLCSGGALTKKGGAAVDLGRARQLEALFPMLSLLGYAAGNSMMRSRVAVDEVHLVCAENRWRMPADLRDHPHATMPSPRARTEGMGTRHDALRDPEVRRMLKGEELEAREGALEVKRSTKIATAAAPESAQMIYDYQCAKPGTLWWGALHLDQVTQMEMAALQGALTEMCYGQTGSGGFELRLGAKGNVGLGRMDTQFSGEIRHLALPETSEAPGMLAPANKTTAEHDGGLGRYEAHLRERREEILAILQEVA